MAWIESHQALSRHRKTLRAAAQLGCDRHKLLGHLHELWWWALDNVPVDGDMDAVTDAEIAAGAQWDGDASAFVAALVQGGRGFIDELAGGKRRLHDWREHAGKLLLAREKNKQRQAEWRAHQAHQAQQAQQTRQGRRGQQTAEAPIDESALRDASRNGYGGSGRNAGVGVTSPLRDAATEQNSTQQDRTEPAAGGKGKGVAPAGAVAPPAATAPAASTGAALAVTGGAGGAGGTRAKANETHPFKGLWDAFDAVMGPVEAPTEKTRRAKACKELDMGHYTPEQVLRAAVAWPNVMGDATLTELGLAANMGKLLHGPQTRGRSNGTTLEHRQRVTESATVRHTVSAADLLGVGKGDGGAGVRHPLDGGVELLADGVDGVGGVEVIGDGR